MPQMPFDPINHPVDYVKLAGVRSPGIATVTGAELKRRFQVNQAYGMTGATIVFKGRELVRFAIELQLCTDQDFEDWDRFKPTVMKDPRRGPAGKKDALDILHPHLEALGVKAVLIESVAAPEQTDDGMWMVKISCIEFRPRPVLALAKPEAAKASPVDVNDQRIERLTAQWQELAAQ